MILREEDREDEVDDEDLLEVAEGDAPQAEVEELAVERVAALLVEALVGLERTGREGGDEHHEGGEAQQRVLLDHAAQAVEDVLQTGGRRSS